MEQLTIDILINQLQGLRERFGDMPVILRDADTCWAFKLKAEHLAVDYDGAGPGKRLQIMANYGDEMEMPRPVGHPQTLLVA